MFLLNFQLEAGSYKRKWYVNFLNVHIRYIHILHVLHDMTFVRNIADKM